MLAAAVVVVLHAFLLVQCFGSPLRAGVAPLDKPALFFSGSNSTFKIVQLADLHFGEGEALPWGPLQDTNSTRVMRNVLRAEAPDLVVFSGDQITGNNVIDNSTAYWAQVVAVCEELGLRWAAIFGNHDDAPLESAAVLRASLGGTYPVNKSREHLLEFDMSHALSYSQPGPKLHGLGNYFLPIFPPQQAALENHTAPTPPPAAALFFFDSGGGTIEEQMHDDQVSWFRNASDVLQRAAGQVVPGLAFFHIPTPGYYSSWYSPQPECVGDMLNGGIDQLPNGEGLEQAFRDKKNVLATFCGHDHGNDYCCKEDKLWFCFGRHSGYGGYGRWTRGGRVIELSLDDDGRGGPLSVATWVRMEDGTVVHEALLD